MKNKIIALTMGDPAGVGPELAVRLAAEVRANKIPAELLIYGSPDILREAAVRFAPDCVYECVPCGDMRFTELKIAQVDPQCGREALEAVRRATLDAIKGKIDAVVTCPMNKAAVNLAGIPFTGHTEFIAGLCGVHDFAMMQSAGNLRVVFATTHIALREVASVLTKERILRVAELLRDVIISEGITNPRIAVAALNPHAGEDGNMGMEDELVTKPAVAELRARGFHVEGPFPPDTLFVERIRSRFDGIVSMYHDQGHIPFKMLAFDRGVNSTLGIPMIRTSVDHGTAFDIAWRGEADMGSLREAFRAALLRAQNRKA